MNAFSRSWSLTTASWGVLRQDKELVLLPVISAVSSLVLIAPFVGIAAMTFRTTGTGGDESYQLGPAGWVALFVAYLLSAYVTIFFQSALVLAANERMTGGSPTLGSALRGAWANAGRILPWALITATVSIVLQFIQQRAGVAGRVVAGLAGVAWALVTLLVLPILVIEQVGVKEAFTRSASAFKRTWGENVIVNGGIGLVSFLALLLGVVVTGPVIYLGAVDGIIGLTVLGVALLAVWIVVVSVVSAALSGVFRTALYRYATRGEDSPGFTHDQIAHAFRPKRRGRGAATA
ncbi:MAG: DUF6159 family protein [Microthrixaceae bacterium]